MTSQKLSPFNEYIFKNFITVVFHTGTELIVTRNVLLYVYNILLSFKLFFDRVLMQMVFARIMASVEVGLFIQAIILITNVGFVLASFIQFDSQNKFVILQVFDSSLSSRILENNFLFSSIT